MADTSRRPPTPGGGSDTLHWARRLRRRGGGDRMTQKGAPASPVAAADSTRTGSTEGG